MIKTIKTTRQKIYDGPKMEKGPKKREKGQDSHFWGEGMGVRDYRGTKISF